MHSLQEIATKLHAVTFYTWFQYGWHDRERELMLFHDDIEHDRRTITKIRFSRFSINVTKTILRQFNPQRNSWTQHCGEGEQVTLPTRKGEKALRELIRKDCLNLKGTENPQQLFTWSAPLQAEVEKTRAELNQWFAHLKAPA